MRLVLDLIEYCVKEVPRFYPISISGYHIREAGADAALQAMARGYMGYSYHAQGQYREAEAVLARNVEKLEALRAAEGAGPQSAISYVSSSGWFAFTLAELGDFDQARTYADMAERAAEAERHAYAQAIAWSLGGLVALQRGHLDRALHLLEKSLETCRSKQLTVWQPIPSSLLGLTQVLLGRHDEGLSLLEDGVARTEALGVKAYLALWTAQLGEGLVAAGQPSRATASAHACSRSARRLYPSPDHARRTSALEATASARQAGNSLSHVL